MSRGDWTTTGGGAAMVAMGPAVYRGGGSAKGPAAPLVARALDGDAGAFEEIVRRHERRVLGLARRLLAQPQDAEDAAQEAFLRLYRALARLDPERPLLPYLYRITVNVCRDLGRRLPRPALPLDEMDAADEPAAPGADPAEASRLAEERRIAAAALRALPEKQRAALVLRDVQGLSTREVAEVLGTSEVTVRTQISRARLKVNEFRERVLGTRGGRKETS